MDLKYYREVTSSQIKTLKSSSTNKDTYFTEKYEAFKSIDSRFNVKKIYYSESLYSFIIIFRCKKDEKEIYLCLDKLKKGYKGMDLELDMQFEENDEGNLFCTLKVFYESEYEKAISKLYYSSSNK